jgi:hypothetical protein
MPTFIIVYFFIIFVFIMLLRLTHAQDYEDFVKSYGLDEPSVLLE